MTRPGLDAEKLADVLSKLGAAMYLPIMSTEFRRVNLEQQVRNQAAAAGVEREFERLWQAELYRGKSFPGEILSMQAVLQIAVATAEPSAVEDTMAKPYKHPDTLKFFHRVRCSDCGIWTALKGAWCMMKWHMGLDIHTVEYKCPRCREVEEGWEVDYDDDPWGEPGYEY